jgi:hypothetical protein
MGVLDDEFEDELDTGAEEALDTGTEIGDEQSSVAAAGEGIEEEGELDVITLKGEKPEDLPEAPQGQLPNRLRKLLREKDKELRELRARTPAPAQVELKPRPKLEQFGFNEEEHAKALDAWYEEKRVKVDEPQARAKREQETAEKEWQAKQAAYNTAKQTLKVKNFAEAEENVKEALSDVQQGLLLDGADRPEVAVYILGMRPKLLAELAAIKSPAKFAARIGKLEADLSIERKAGAPAPEARAPRAAGSAGSIGNAAYERELARLEKEYERTGDRTAIRKLKEKYNRA